MRPSVAEIVDKRVLAPVRHPDFFGAGFGNGLDQLRPIDVIGNDERQLDAALAGPAANAHPAAGEGVDRIAEAARPAIAKRRRRTHHDAAEHRFLVGARNRAHVAEIDAELLVKLGQRDDGAVQIDRLVVTGIADDADHPLALAETIGADQMRAVRFGGHRRQKLLDLVVGFLMPKDRKRKRRLGHEDIARHKLERRAGRIAGALVVAGDDGAAAGPLDHDLGRAQNVPGRHETHADAVDR